eukprot:13717384-Alexandrium_andersonii.AAC.1
MEAVKASATMRERAQQAIEADEASIYHTREFYASSLVALDRRKAGVDAFLGLKEGCDAGAKHTSGEMVATLAAVKETLGDANMPCASFLAMSPLCVLEANAKEPGSGALSEKALNDAELKFKTDIDRVRLLVEHLRKA